MGGRDRSKLAETLGLEAGTANLRAAALSQAQARGVVGFGLAEPLLVCPTPAENKVRG